MCLNHTGHYLIRVYDNPRSGQTGPGFLWPCPGPCITTAIWRCRNPFSQWQRSFQWKLCFHWLKSCEASYRRNNTGPWLTPATALVRCGLFSCPTARDCRVLAWWRHDCQLSWVWDKAIHWLVSPLVWLVNLNIDWGVPKTALNFWEICNALWVPFTTDNLNQPWNLQAQSIGTKWLFADRNKHCSWLSGPQLNFIVKAFWHLQ